MILLVPTSSGMLEMRQLCVPAASPEAPNVLAQRTATTPTLSAAVPVKQMVAAELLTMDVPGAVIDRVGGMESVVPSTCNVISLV